MRFFIICLLSIIAVMGICQDTEIDRAEQLINNNQFEDAITILNGIILIEEKPKALRLLASIHFKNKDPERAKEVLKEAIALAKNTFNNVEQAEGQLALARVNAIGGDFNLATENAIAGSHTARFIGNMALEFRLNSILSWAYFITNKDFGEVLLHESRQKYLVEKIGTEAQKALVYNNLGYDLTIAGNVALDSAIMLMVTANNIYATQENHNGRWYTLMNLTWQYRLKGEYKKSEEYGLLSVAQATSENDRHAIIESCFQLGETMLAQKEIEKGKEYYNTVLEWSTQQNDRDKYVFDVYYSRFLWRTGRKDEAIDLLEKAIEYLQTSEVFYEMHGRALLANYYYENGDLKNAKEQIDKISNPRHNYIALETKCMTALTLAKIMNTEKQEERANTLLKNWLSHTRKIGMDHLEYEFMDLIGD